MTKPKPMTEAELKALIDQEAWASQGYIGKLTEQRRRGLEAYEAKATGDFAPPEVEGRSTVVSPDVADVIDGAMPSFLRIFESGDEVVAFEERRPEDADKAKAATDYVNWVYRTQNDGFKVTYTWIKDALLSKNGIVKVWFDDSTEISEESYTGLTETQMASIIEPDDVEVLEHASYEDESDADKREEALQQAQQLAQAGQMEQAQQIAQALQAPVPELHDIKIRRTCSHKKIRVENVPPEEFLISRQAKSLDDAAFVAHRVQRTLSQLVAMGYDREKVMLLADDNNWANYSSESIERRTNDDEWTYGLHHQQQGGSDPMSRRVWLIESYIQCDFDGDGYTETRKVVKAGFEILENEVVDGNPFASLTPVIMPHRFFGKSMADQVYDWQRVKTALLRQLLDALYLGNNPRTVAVEGQVNLDDLLTSRPGGVVRTKSPNAVAPLLTQDVSAQAITGLQFVSGIVQERSGVKPMNAGLDPNAINKTATGEHMLQDAAMQKLELIARVFAETGFKRLFKLILKLATRYQNKPEWIKVAGKWVEVDPREWKDGFNLTVSVGLGTGDRTKQAMQLQQLIASQMQLMPLGITTPAHIFNAAKKLPGVLGYKQEDQFFADPAEHPIPKQPGPMDIEQMKAQMSMQAEQAKAQMKAQTDTQAKQAEMQLERERMQMQAQVDTHRQKVEAEQKQLELAQERELEEFKAKLQAALDEQRERMSQETAIRVAEINAWAKVSDQQQKPAEGEAKPDKIDALTQMVMSLAEQMSAPREIVRDETGRVAGTRIVKQPPTVQ